MENVLVDRSAGGDAFRRSAGMRGCRRMLPGSMPAPPYPVGYGSLSPYSSSLPPNPFLYAPYDFLCYRSPHQSLPPLPSHGLPPLPPAAVAKAKHASLPHLRSATTLPAPPRKTVGESSYKRKKPRAPSSLPLPTFSLVRAAAAAKAAPPSCAV